MNFPFSKSIKLIRKNYTKSIYEPNAVINEYVKPVDLYSIVKNSNDVKYTEDHPQFQTYKSIHDQLNAYKSLYNEDDECFNITLSLPKHKWGRQNPIKQLGLCVFHRPHRHSLANDYYDDYDMINAEPEIYNQVLKQNKQTFECLSFYCENRDILLQQISSHYNLPKSDIKKLIIALMNGGELSTFVKKHNLIGAEHHLFILQFSQQITKIIDYVYLHNSHIADNVNKENPEKFKSLNGNELLLARKRCVAGLFYTTIERHVQECAISFLVENKGYNLKDDFVPSQDGFMLKKELSYPELIQNIENAVKNKFGFVIPFKKKPFDEMFEFDLIPNFVIPTTNTDDIAECIKDNQGSSDYDLAKKVARLYGDNFLCASINNNIWYEFKEHRWVLTECATTLHLIIPNQFRDYMKAKADKINELTMKTKDEELIKQLNAISKRICETVGRLGRSNDIKNIMSELKHILYEPDFIEKLDIKHILCCKNGVIDFTTGIFRDGLKTDYCSKTTGIMYIENNEDLNEQDVDDLKTFLDQVFPFYDQQRYFLEHLSAMLIGDCKNELMFHYFGEGANSKSVITKLIAKMLGEYAGIVPTTLICSKRGDIGKCSPEVAGLKGLRYAVMQEPTEGDIVNDGVMKQLTGNDPITGRALYQNPITFLPTFTLICTTNILLGMKSTIHGTWRRQSVITFQSKFSEAHELDSTDELNFLMDKSLKHKLNRFIEPLFSFLVKQAFITKGDIAECALVNADTLKYRNSQNRVEQFISENIINQDNATTSKIYLSNCANNWFENNYKHKIQNTTIFKVLDKKYETNRNGEYIGFRLKDFGFECNVIEISKEDIFTREFKRFFEITNSPDDFIPSINISGWAKEQLLKVNTSKQINPLLIPLGLDVKNKQHYKDKKILGKAVQCWIGIKRREVPLENIVIENNQDLTDCEEEDEINVYE